MIMAVESGWIREGEADIPQNHVMPSGNDHADHPECWCEPQLEYRDPETGNEVWVHRRLQ
jgi:hypothetical protein